MRRNAEILLSIHLGLETSVLMCIPLSLCMVFSSFLAVAFRNDDPSFQTYLMYNSPAASTSTELVHAVVNALLIVGFVALMTFGIVCLMKYKAAKCFQAYIVVAIWLVLVTGGAALYDEIIRRMAWHVDVISFYGLTYNFGTVGAIGIFYQKGMDSSLSQAYLVFVAMLAAWQFSQFPEWTTWSLLITLAFYDCCAVLLPYGPLNLLMKHVEENETQLTGMLYEADIPASALQRQFIQQPAHNKEQQQAISISESTPLKVEHFSQVTHLDDETVELDLEPLRHSPNNTIKLGLGDFVFYSVLVSRAAMFQFSTMMACLVTILVVSSSGQAATNVAQLTHVQGFFTTLIFLQFYRAALPALPISILAGSAIYFVARFCATPFVFYCGMSAVFV